MTITQQNNKKCLRFYGLEAARFNKGGCIYLDSAATTLMMINAKEAADHFLEYYSNVHTNAHNKAKISGICLEWAYQKVTEFLKCSETHEALFMGSGATAAINGFAQLMRFNFPSRRMVVISSMEHHSNDLPHRQNFSEAVFVPLSSKGKSAGGIDLNFLNNILEENQGRVAYVAVTGLSNVTGVRTPLQQICEIAHRHDTVVLVDGAQMVSRTRVDLTALGVDAFAFSGHKLYAPGSPGVLAIKKNLLEQLSPIYVGGGIVDDVTTSNYILSSKLRERHQPGTPNIYGAILLAYAMHSLIEYGMDYIEEHEQNLCDYARKLLTQIPEVTCYGCIDNSAGANSGCITFNILDLPHELVGRILNDHYGIAVRNGCFCAHPYVRSLLQEELWELDANPENPDDINRIDSFKGMVRASFGVYTSKQDIDALAKAISIIVQNKTNFLNNYISSSIPLTSSVSEFNPLKLLSTGNSQYEI